MYRVLGCTSKIWFKVKKVDFFKIALHNRLMVSLYLCEGRTDEVKGDKLMRYRPSNAAEMRRSLKSF